MKGFGLLRLCRVGCLSLLAAVMLSACGQGQRATDLETFMATEVNPNKPLPALPSVAPPEDFVYDPGEIPDPFKPRILKPTKSGGAFQPDLNRPKEPLERFPLENLQMMGTLKKEGQIVVLIRSPEGEVYSLHKGNRLGLNFGQITRILDNSIEIKETVQDGMGDWVESNASLAIQEVK
jgi:type IV pilus assembly protein PilP